MGECREEEEENREEKWLQSLIIFWIVTASRGVIVKKLENKGSKWKSKRRRKQREEKWLQSLIIFNLNREWKRNSQEIGKQAVRRKNESEKLDLIM